MVACIEQYVAESRPDLSWGFQYVQVVAIREDLPRSSERPVHGPCQSGADRHHPASERRSIARFDDEMHVVPLQRVVDQPKAWTCTTPTERVLNLANYLPRPQ